VTVSSLSTVAVGCCLALLSRAFSCSFGPSLNRRLIASIESKFRGFKAAIALTMLDVFTLNECLSLSSIDANINFVQLSLRFVFMTILAMAPGGGEESWTVCIDFRVICLVFSTSS